MIKLNNYSKTTWIKGNCIASEKLAAPDVLDDITSIIDIWGDDVKIEKTKTGYNCKTLKIVLSYYNKKICYDYIGDVWQ